MKEGVKMKLYSIKKIIAFSVLIVLICTVFSGIALMNKEDNSNAQGMESVIITLTIGEPYMSVNEESLEIDPGRGTVPVDNSQ